MRRIDVYYITREKTIKIHGAGIAYNAISTYVVGKCVFIGSTVIGVAPIVVITGISACNIIRKFI